MHPIRYTLVADGTSDRCLLRIIDWLLGTSQLVRDRGLLSTFADFRRFEAPPVKLHEKIAEAVKHFPCDIVFIHRDAEKESHQFRLKEIKMAVEESQPSLHVALVPVRMTEAWLLVDKAAIRRAADNPNGTVELVLPKTIELEKLPDPKDTLRNLIIKASDKRGRQQRRFKRDVSQRIQRVADNIKDYSTLMSLPAFRLFESETRKVLRDLKNNMEQG